jgi:hypothetical protein
MSCTPNAIDDLIEKVVQAASPLRIIVFGSAARGQVLFPTDDVMSLG